MLLVLRILTRATRRRFLAEPACILLMHEIRTETAAIATAAGCMVDFDVDAFVTLALLFLFDWR